MDFLQNPPEKISYAPRKRRPQIKLFLYFGKQKSPIFFYISGNGTFRAQKMKRKPKMLLIL